MRYKPYHNAYKEWVYNDAGLDGALVIWARDIGDAENQALAKYFKGRHVWLLEPDEPNPTLSPYLSDEQAGRTLRT